MKISVNVNLNKLTIPIDFEKAKAYFTKHGVDIEFTFKQVNVSGYTSQIVTVMGGGQRYVVFGAETLVPITTSDVNMFVFNQYEWATPPGSPFPLKSDTPTGSCFVYQGKPFVVIPFYGDTTNLIMHELMHALCKLANLKGFPVQDFMDTYYLNHQPDNTQSNFGQQWVRLEAFVKSQNGYKYFSVAEVSKWGLKPELWAMLDKAREYAGIPFRITSGLRSPSQNASVGGAEESNHLTGEAVDLRALNSNEHFLITKGLILAGFKRISKKYPTHVHADISKDKSQNVLF